MNKAYGSSMTGDISWFSQKLKKREHDVSFTIDDGFNFNDQSWFRVHHQVEPTEVLDITDRLIQVHKFYDLILTWNEKVLSKCDNAVFLPEGVCSWLPRERGDIVYTPPNVNTKQFVASFITSSKGFCPGHKLRLEIFDALKETYGDLKIVKHKSPPRWEDKRTIIEPYQYHIAVENAEHDNWFADKIVDAFIGKAIPLYWGCPNLGNFFNLNGVIRFTSVEDLKEKLKSLTPEYYKDHLYAVEDNYQRSLKYVHTWDRIEAAITEGIEKKKRLKLEHDNAVNKINPPSVAVWRPLRRVI